MSSKISTTSFTAIADACSQILNTLYHYVSPLRFVVDEESKDLSEAPSDSLLLSELLSQ